VGGGKDDPSPKLRQVIAQLQRDPAKAQDLAARLERDDPALFMELIEWVKSLKQ